MSERRTCWEFVADHAKRSSAALVIADFLGRGTGRARVLDRLICRGIAASRFTPDLPAFSAAPASIIHIGHATLLIRIAGMNILTDPVFSPSIGIGLGLVTAGPRRLIAPGLPLERLPPIDVILISHAHVDHLDRPTLVRLNKRCHVVMAHGSRDLVADLGFSRISELTPGQKLDLDGLEITALPVKHWGARVFYDMHRGYCAFLLASAGSRILFGGDSAYHEMWRSAGPVDVCCVGIAAYEPFVHTHATPEQAVAMARLVQARYVLPMHHSVFRLSGEPIAEPLRRFRAAVDPGAEAAAEVGQQWCAQTA